MTKPSASSLSLILALGLVACGGGGSGDDSAPVETASYLPGQAELGAWNVLQQARTLCGFGALTRNTKLDEAALNHSKYLVDRSFVTGASELSHLESPGVPGFTGIYPWDRAQATGYGTQVAEILEATVWDYTTSPVFPSMQERGANSMHSLLNTVYHLAGAMYDGTDVGFGAYMKTSLINATTWREEYRFGSLNGYQTSRISLGAGKIATYPCEGSTKVATSFIPANESPNPIPAMTLATEKVGPPIYIKVDAGQKLAVTSVSVSQNGMQVPSTVMNNANDPHSDMYGEKYIGLNEAFVIPTTALLPNSTYLVNFSGTINDKAFSRSFSMSTGS